MALTETEEALLREILVQKPELDSLADNEAAIIAKLANTKIALADLTAAVSVSGSDLTLVSQGGVAKKATASVFNTAVLSDLASTATGKGASLIGFQQSGTGAIASTAQDKLRETISVKDFGAVGDGITDDAAAINAAQNALSSAGGGILFWPPGTYLTKSILVLYSNIIWQGSGIDVSIIKADSSMTTDMIATNGFYGLTGTNSTAGIYKFGLRDIGINGNKAARGAAGNCLVIYGYDYFLNNVIIYNAPLDGMYSEWGTSPGAPSNASPAGDFMESSLCRVKFFNNTRDGLVFNGPHDTQINNLLTYNNGRYGAWFGQSANYSGSATVLNSFHAYGNGSWGAKIDTAIVGVEIQSETNGFGFGGTGGIVVTSPNGSLAASEVQVFNNTGTGISYQNAGGKLAGVAAWINTGDGINISNIKNTLTGVHSYNNGGNGLTLTTAAGQCVISAANLELNTGHGLSLAGVQTVSTGLMINNNTGNGVTVASTATQTIIEGLHAVSNTLAGVNCSADDMKLSGTITSNGANGLVLSNGLSGLQINAKCETNTGTQAVLGMLGASGNMIDLLLYTTTGQTGWSGTVGNNFARIGAAGVSVVPNNSIQT